jgi:hypothetical protein
VVKLAGVDHVDHGEVRTKRKSKHAMKDDAGYGVDGGTRSAQAET